MARYLLGASELEQNIEAIVNENLGVCFAAEVTNAMQRLVDSYNHCQTDELLDRLAAPWTDWLEDYAPLDRIVESFTQLVESCINPTTDIAVLDYLPKEETLVVTQQPKPAPDPVKHLKDEYQHATMQGDFYPERIRRALDELAAYI